MSKDEDYILDICDKVLRRESVRQKRFDFLRGLPSRKTGRCAMLPVDAYYPAKELVIEYHEKQHTKSGWNRPTACGLNRDEQRRRYDEIRKKTLPKKGIKLVVIDYMEFETNAKGRLKRTKSDRATVRRLLHKFI